jgi:hypothetical protein
MYPQTPPQRKRKRKNQQKMNQINVYVSIDPFFKVLQMLKLQISSRHVRVH